jgi:hypothetical protein
MSARRHWKPAASSRNDVSLTSVRFLPGQHVIAGGEPSLAIDDRWRGLGGQLLEW